MAGEGPIREGRGRTAQGAVELLVVLPAARETYATSCIDVSDGFIIDLERICEASKASYRVALNSNHTSTGKADLYCGDDYVLCFTSSRSNLEKVLDISKDILHIGFITNKSNQNEILYDNQKVSFDTKGWDSFNQ